MIYSIKYFFYDWNVPLRIVDSTLKTEQGAYM